MSFQDKDQSPKRVCLGRIAAPHGVKGLVKILPYGDDPTLLESAEAVYTSETGFDTLKISLKNKLGKYILAHIDGCDDRNASEDLKGTEFFVERDVLPDLEDGEGFYYEDLVGLKVLDKDGKHIGKIIAVENFGAGDLLEIQPLSGASYYVPLVDDYVLSIDIEGKVISVGDTSQFAELA